MADTFKLADYEISEELGFLSSCPRNLPPYYERWQTVADQLPTILASKDQLESAVASIPLLDTSSLNQDEQKTAYVILSYLVHAYIWQDNGAPRTIVPPNLAIPFNKVCSSLGITPIITYAAVGLYNWHLATSSRAHPEPEAFRFRCRFTTMVDEEWFGAVHMAMEARGGTALDAAVRLAIIAPHLEDEDTREAACCQIRDDLAILCVTMQDICKLISRMYEKCDPAKFFDGFRPYFDGWDKLPNGVYFEESTHYRGASAAQSSLIQAFDRILGVEHNDEETKGFLGEMLRYMPRPHRNFLLDLSKRSIRAWIHNFASVEVISGYNLCIDKLVDLRQAHYGLAKSYVIDQIRRKMGLQETEHAVGTGGTVIRTFLEKTIKETKEAKL